MPITFRIVSINSRSITNDVKRRAVLDYHKKNSDILIIQETHSIKENELIWESEWGGKAIFSHGTPAARGVAIFTTKKLYAQMSNIHVSADGRTIILDIEENNIFITIAAIYAPNKDSPAYFTDLGNLLRSRKERKIIVGDFNLTLDVELDRHNTYFNNSKAKEEVDNLCDEFLLKDVWRDRNPESREFSWRKGSTDKMSRIDLALVSGGVDQNVQHITYISSIKTDHRALYLGDQT